ncbi:ral guanine nucleotide dissociation stimulator-like [Arvicanthis niloticus]|uniref:ral guanine nucleotide dissociation stimulator-like n=1 Tax=Arvicanthis niloticus TaxID=61156 RepID=UPI001487175E|nr:ral guanine nucleotide dissociation stimulator-like [Arvicanthis niloticus]XP_034365596.1 ral guanine nucleotide dissociation stimulator-like [Arvicanthis niloticus]
MSLERAGCSLCCCWTTGDSGLKKDKSEDHGGIWKFMIFSCLQCLWPFAQEETDLTQDSQAQDHADKGEHECTSKNMKEACKESRITADMVKKLVNHLVPSLLDGDPCFATDFLYFYRSFTTTRHVVDLLLKRYAYFRPDCKEDEQVKRMLCTFLDIWIDKYPEEFCQTSDLSILRKLKAYLIVNMPYSDLNLRVHLLLVDLQGVRESQ